MGRREYIQAAEEKKAFLEEQRDLLRKADARWAQDVERFEQLHAHTRNELAAYLLAEADDEDLTALEKKLELPGLLKTKRDFEEKLRVAQEELEQIEANPDFQNYSLERRLADEELQELKPKAEELEIQMGHFESSRWHAELNGRGWYAPDYRPGGLWARFKDWRAVSFLMSEIERHFDKDFEDSDDVKLTWRMLADEAAPIIEATRGLEERILRLDSRAKRHGYLVEAPQRLFNEMYEALSVQVLNHLDACPPELRFELAAEDEFLITFLKKEVGVRKQAMYLRELRVNRIQRRIKDLDQRIAKLERKIGKVRRKWKRKYEKDIASFKKRKTDKWAKRHRKLDKMRGRITDFHKYQKGSFAEDFLWWDLITRGKRGDDIYEVRVFKENHPTWSYQTHQDPWEDASTSSAESAVDHAADALAAATLAAQQDDGWDTDIS